MFARTISLVLIAAVVACPLWCDSGFCHGDQQRAAGESERCPSCPTRDVSEQSCRKTDSDQPHEDRQPCPCESGDCQGICGGAVLERSITIDFGADGVFVILDDAPSAWSPRSVVNSHNQDQRHHCGAGCNYGRFVRTLRMSFLC